jgi:hypothetical protein
MSPLRRADIPESSQFLIGGSGVPATSALFSHEVVLRKFATSKTEYAIGGTEKASRPSKVGLRAEAPARHLS